MPDDPLDTVLKLRRRAVAEARQRLAASTDAAAQAAAEARALERLIETETRLASDPEGTDQTVEAFAAWLPRARTSATQARAAHERQEAESARRRAELNACRTALETIETLIERRLATRTEAATRRQQHELDEASLRRPSS